eukprot:gene14224-14368_t
MLLEHDINGRAYFGCPDEDDSNCGHKIYCDQQKQTCVSEGVGPSYGTAVVRYPSHFQQQGISGTGTPPGSTDPGWVIQGNDGSTAEPLGGNDLTPAPLCFCQEESVRITSRSERNPGRDFFACAKDRNQPQKCKFFKWADEVCGSNSSGVAAAGGTVAAGFMGGDHGPTGAYAATAGGGFAGTGAAAEADASVVSDAPLCECQVPSFLYTSRSERNPNRQFYGCSKPRDDPSKCKFFKWADEVGSSGSGSQQQPHQAAAGVAYGFGGSALPNGAAAAGAVGSGPHGAAGAAVGGDAVVLCVCGQPALQRTSNTSKNPGRVFYKCPKPQGEQCDFFQWADDPGSGSKRVSGYDRISSGAGATTVQADSQQQAAFGGYGAPAAGAAWNSMGSGLNGLSYGGSSSAGAAGAAGGPAGGSGGAGTGTAGGSSGNTCFKCGQDGHWARDCPNTGLGAGVGGGYGGNNYYGGGGGGGGSSSVCFKCQQPGHYARDCPNVATTTTTGSGFRNEGYGSRGSAGSGSRPGACFKCNQPGHWASQCPNAR